MNQLAPDLTDDMSYSDVLRLLTVTAGRLHVMADAVEKDLEGEREDDGR